MKIALSFSGCHRRAGVERIIFESARYLSSRGHEITVLADDVEEDSTARIRYEHVPVRHRPGFAAGRSFFHHASQMLQKVPHDALGTFGCVSPVGGVQWVQSVHRAWLHEAKRFRAPFSMGRLRQRLNPFHPIMLRMEANHYRRRQYKKLIAVSESVKQDLMRWYDVPDSDIVTIPNGYSQTEFNVESVQAGRDSMRKKLGYEPDDKVIVFVANELERKGFGPLMRAMASISDPRLHLLVVGRVTSDRYAEEMRTLGVDQRVKFVGPTAKVATYYAAADIFALPTQYEAWGLVIVEAMACGLPVLTSRLAGASIAVDEGKSGLLLDDPADVEEIAANLKRLLAGDHESREKTSKSVERFAWPNVLSEYEKVLTAGIGTTT